MVLRSDEEANLSEMERDKRFRGNIGKGIGAAASLGTAAIAAPIASKVMPFLSEYIPTHLAIKGINKVSPRLGKFLNKGQEMGLDAREGLDFIKGKLSGDQSKAALHSEDASETSQKPPAQQKNIIAQYADDLDAFIQEQIGNGRNPLEAGALAQLQSKWNKVISKMESDHKTPFSAILEATYGQSQPESKAALQEPTQSAPKNQGGDEALMAAFQKIMNM